MKFDTSLVHGAHERPIDGSVVPPIFSSTTYLSEGQRDYASIRYGRLANTPTVAALSRKIAALEGAESASVFSSGMAAITSTLLGLIPKGGHLFAQAELYGATAHFLQNEFQDYGRRVSFFSVADTASAMKELKAGVTAIYVESISNPCLRIPHFRALVDGARAAGALAIIDNTFASPVNFRPLATGFDLVLHSATKYLNGHSDVVAGVVSGRREHIAKIRATANYLGGCLDPFACYLLDRGLRTLGVRVRAQNNSALALAHALGDMGRVRRVFYPFLESHPDHQRAKEYLTGGGGMIAFEADPTKGDVDQHLAALKLASVAVSLGGVETLVTRPAATSHLSLTQEERESQGIADGLVRVSVGLEDIEDLIADFGSAFG